MATAVKSPALSTPGNSKPPVPPKPSGDGRRSASQPRSHLASSSSPSPPPPSTSPPPHLKALVLAEQAKNRNPDQPSTSATPGPSTSSDKSSKPSTSNVKRSQSNVIERKNYVLKPLRLHESFQERQKKPKIAKRSKDEKESGSLTDWFCVPLSSFVVKTKAGGSALVEKGTQKLFRKGPPAPKKLKRPAPLPPKSTDSSISSKPKVPPRPVLKRILAGLSNGEKEGIWYRLENVKYVDENDSTEDSTDYTDVDWGQALRTEPGEETIIYYTYVIESPFEKVVFYKRVARDELLSSSEEEEIHVAREEDSEVESMDYEIENDQVIRNGESVENVEETTAVQSVEQVTQVQRSTSQSTQIVEKSPPTVESPQIVKKSPSPTESPQIVKKSPSPTESPQIVKKSPSPTESPQIVKKSPSPTESPQIIKKSPLTSEKPVILKKTPPPRPPSPKITPVEARSPTPQITIDEVDEEPEISTENQALEISDGQGSIGESNQEAVSTDDQNISIEDNREISPSDDQEINIEKKEINTDDTNRVSVEKDGADVSKDDLKSDAENNKEFSSGDGKVEEDALKEITTVDDVLIESTTVEEVITQTKASDPQYASVQKVINETGKGNYYDLDVPTSPKSKTKPKRPPPPSQPPPPPPRLVPPPIPPKTYMKLKFPPEKEVVETEEKNSEITIQAEIVAEPEEERVSLKTEESQGGLEVELMEPEIKEPEAEKQVEKEPEPERQVEEKPENKIVNEVQEPKETWDIQDEPKEINKNIDTEPVFEEVLLPNQPLPSFMDTSGHSMSPVEFEKPHLSESIPSGITSESGFLSSPTPPPRHRKKRFRSADGPSRSVDTESPIRRSKSCSEADISRPSSSASGMRTLTRDMSTNTTPERPPRPRPSLKPKPHCPARPPRPGPASLRKLVKPDVRPESSQRISSPDGDATSLSTDGGSPQLERLKTRPLPPPPTPVRQKNVSKGKDKPDAAEKGPLNFPLEFFTKLSEIEAGKLNLTEINVQKINVQEIDAATIRVGSMQVGAIVPLSDFGGSGDGGVGGGNLDKSKDSDKQDESERSKSKEFSESEDSKKPDWWEKSEPLSEDSTLMEEGNPKKFHVIDKLVVSPVPVQPASGGSVFYTDVKDGDQEQKEGSPPLSHKSTSSGSSGKIGRKKSEKQTSWYDEGDIPGQSGDVDTSDGRAEGGVESPFSEPTHVFTVVSGRKKSGRVGRGSLQLYPREDNMSSSSTTDVDESDVKGGEKHHHHHKHSGRPRSLSAGCTEPSPEIRIQRMQLDPNANYYEEPTEEVEEVTDPSVLPLPECPGNGRCGTPENLDSTIEGGNDSTIEAGNDSTVEAGNDSVIEREKAPLKRHSTHSLQASEDSWYNCTSGDESEAESSNSFLTAQSCADDGSSASSSVAEHRQSKKFYIASELMNSEKVFVDTLKLLNEDFREAVVQANCLPRSILDQIFNYLPQLQNLNQDLLKDLTERINNWNEAGRIADVITKKGPFLKLYSSYIKDFESLMSILDDACKKYPAFAQTVKEFEMSPRCNKLAIKHYMLKPVQRIPQYRLLLGDYLKHLTLNSPEYEETVAALTIVSDVANHANQTMKQGDNFAKLLQIQNSIIGDHEIIRPGRTFLKEGELFKLSRKVMQPRWFILFNDVLLHTDVIQQGSYRLHHELPLLGMRVTVPTNEEYLNEFSIISNTRSFILSASSPSERDQWIKALMNAISTNAQRRGTFAGSKGSKNSEDTLSDAMLGNQAPVWIPDSRVTMCQICTAPFTVTFRRHHCRACGKVVCAPCSSNKAPLPYQQNQCGRVCDICFPMLAQAFASPSEDIDTKTNLRSQFKKYAGGNGKKAGRRLPQVLKEVGANHQGAAISGYLQKKVKKTWRRYWFVINEKVLYTYKASEDVAALESIPLLGFQLGPCLDLFENADPKLGFQLDHPSHQSIMFYAENEATVEKWKKEMHSATLLE